MGENETAAQMLRKAAKLPNGKISAAVCTCEICEATIGSRCGNGDCNRWPAMLADLIDEEVAEASATRCTAYIDNLARLGRVPARDHGETLEKWLGRCYLPVPRYTDGEPVSVGSVSEYGTVAMVEVRLTDGGWGNWTLYTEEQADPVEGTLSERVPRGLLVEGKPVREGDALWFDTERVIVTDVDGLSDTIFTDYLTEDTEGEWFPYPFESADLSWERPEEPDTIERIRADAVKNFDKYWGCEGVCCSDCPAKVDGKKPYERYGTEVCGTAMLKDVVRRTEEVCKR